MLWLKRLTSAFTHLVDGEDPAPGVERLSRRHRAIFSPEEYQANITRQKTRSYHGKKAIRC